MHILIKAVGDSALKVEFPGKVSPKLNAKVQLFCEKLRHANIEGIGELVPAFDSVTIYYEPQKIVYRDLSEKMYEVVEMPLQTENKASRIIHIPVLYGGDFGPDLERVANYNQLAVEEVIEIHQKPEYLIYMLGFLPGFPYLGGLDSRIATPRLEEPRAKTFAGAVGIAHKQTGIYPIESPGGWNIIGKTPIQLFSLQHEKDAFLFQAGDSVRFYRVTENEFDEIKEKVEAGNFEKI